MATFRWLYVPQLETDRLRLQCLGREEAKQLLEICRDPEVTRYAGDLPFVGPQNVRQLLSEVADRFRCREAIEWAIVEKQSEQVVGTCGLHSFDAVNRDAKIGCLLGRTFWGQGFMTEALPALFDFARCELELRSLIAEVEDLNVRSMQLFQRLDFRRCGSIDLGWIFLQEL